jgi:Zn-dependent protease
MSLADLNLGVLIASILVLLLSLSVHEAAHAWTAFRLGDPTGRDLGRASLNPLVHIDPIGTVLLPLVAMATGAPLIGWAKPVPVDTRRLRRYPRDWMAVAAAGPASNLVLAAVASVLVTLVPSGPVSLGGMDVGEPLRFMLGAAFRLNLLLAVFNMLPIPPLDGGNVLGGLLRGRLSEGYEALRPWGVMILYALMFTGALGTLLGPPYAFLARLLTL